MIKGTLILAVVMMCATGNTTEKKASKKAAPQAVTEKRFDISHSDYVLMPTEQRAEYAKALFKVIDEYEQVADKKHCVVGGGVYAPTADGCKQPFLTCEKTSKVQCAPWFETSECVDGSKTTLSCVSMVKDFNVVATRLATKANAVSWIFLSQAVNAHCLKNETESCKKISELHPKKTALDLQDKGKKPSAILWLIEKFFPSAQAQGKCGWDGENYTHPNGNKVRIFFGSHVDPAGAMAFDRRLASGNMTGIQEGVSALIRSHSSIEAQIQRQTAVMLSAIRAGNWIGHEAANSAVKPGVIYQTTSSMVSQLIAAGVSREQAERAVNIRVGAQAFAAYKHIEELRQQNKALILANQFGVDHHDANQKVFEMSLRESAIRDQLSGQMSSQLRTKFYREIYQATSTDRLATHRMNQLSRIDINAYPEANRQALKEIIRLNIEMENLNGIRDREMASNIKSRANSGNGAIVIGDSHRIGIVAGLNSGCDVQMSNAPDASGSGRL